MQPLLVLGAGQVGEALLRLRPDALGSSRSGRDGLLLFDLARPETWDCLPPASSVIWTFPPVPETPALAFGRRILASGSRLIVLASTSCHLAPELGRLDENCPLDLAQERVRAEESLRREGAIVLALAGLHGPQRRPAEWIRRGLIRNGAKLVNLIHVEDAAAISLALLERASPGERFVASDGQGRPWSAIAAELGLEVPSGSPEGRRVDPARLLKLMPPDFHFRGIDL
ncbi:MAG: hypothetical protein RL095_1641 [Verrucomicrobiota bacterium]